jgi:hypothetical protein
MSHPKRRPGESRDSSAIKPVNLFSEKLLT